MMGSTLLSVTTVEALDGLLASHDAALGDLEQLLGTTPAELRRRITSEAGSPIRPPELDAELLSREFYFGAALADDGHPGSCFVVDPPHVHLQSTPISAIR